MDLISILILGLTQGITEWVPISSKTQDTLVYLKLLNGDPSSLVPILLFLHLGTLFAAMIYFRKEIIELILQVLKQPLAFKEHSETRVGFIFTSLLFTGIVGVPILLMEKKFFPSLDGTALFALMGAGLLVTGFLLLNQKGTNKRKTEDANWKDGILTGVLQGISTLPGVSRSGTSATALIWRGFDSGSSFQLSFLLSIPTVIIAEIILYLGDLFFSATGMISFPIQDAVLLAASSFVFGYLTLDAVLRIVKRVNLAYVAFAMGLIIIAAALLGAG